MQPKNQGRRTKARPYGQEQITQLSETTLKQHDAIPVLVWEEPFLYTAHLAPKPRTDIFQPDDIYAESLIRSEAAQMFERTMATVAGQAKETPSMSSKQGGLRSGDGSSTSELEHLPNLYRPDKSSSTMPMQRFTTLGPANDPMPWESRRVMADAGLATGSLEMLQARVDAAASLVADNMASSNSSRLDAVGSGSG